MRTATVTVSCVDCRTPIQIVHRVGGPRVSRSMQICLDCEEARVEAGVL